MTRPDEFTRVFRQGRRISAGSLQIVCAPSEAGYARLGLAVAKRILPRAVDRNRAKRVIRESFRHQAADLPPLDVVVTLRGGKIRGVPADMSNRLEALWLRLATD
ncbi:ribonuclease P [Oceanococcus atlanticus]|uniref:Ribonuclease P protein component n=1 Tax=Oceanococcus atlanticus TaxID=1317117 RepID=A0A1Y1SIP2_9GAMM|nr:ribonuclease P [Oceanococcus atlanticus]